MNVIEKGQWKGWTQYPDGKFSKGFGPKGSNPTVYCVQGYFQVFDKEGRRVPGEFDVLKDALEAVGIKKK